MEKVRYGVIAAAGKGTRAYPRTTFIPKPLFEIDGKTILQRNLELLSKTLKVEKIFILVGHLREQVVAEVDRLEKEKRIKASLETVPWTEKGLASDVASLEQRILAPFFLILGDEFYFYTNHEAFFKTIQTYPKLSASIGIQKTNLLSRIRKNYSVEVEKDKIIELVEKPDDPPNQLLGLGSYFFTQEYFSFFKQTPPSPKSGVIELTDVIHNMAKNTKGGVYSTVLDCQYFNINSMQDYHHAVYEVRNKTFDRYKVSLIIPTWNNERSITDVITDFKGKAQEVLVVDAASTDGTVAFAKKEKAKVVEIGAPNGHGSQVGLQIRRGIEEATGDILVFVAPDGSFRCKDFPKFMEYLKDCDMVIGTRTTRQMIEQGSNLNPFERLVSLVMGKLIEIFWWGREPRFTDVGCQYMAIWKEAYMKIKDSANCDDELFYPELMIEITRAHLRCIEIPVSYYKPVHSEKRTKALVLVEAFKIIKLIFSKKLRKDE